MSTSDARAPVRDGHLAHHFDTPAQQFSSAKLGMWLFLATEILLFGGLFCAYAVYRSNHPEIFIYAHRYLDRNLGAVNTAILLASSFTMAWAVRAAQLGRAALFFHYPHYYETTTPVSAVRAGDWKLLEYFEDGRRELFNLRADPGESVDQSGREPARADELCRRLEQWRREVGAKLPTPNPAWRAKK